MKNGLKVYFCKRTSQDNAKIETFAKPIEFTLRFGYLTIQTSSGYNEVVEFGDNVSKTWTCYGQPYDEWFARLNEGDRFYVDGKIPDGFSSATEPEDGWGYDANAIVYSVRPQNIAIKFILEKIE
ncbi:MAG: hypothetical protein EOL95_09460 [Bacteroidia bacterium]|nr:hypothetical protein [Bacteroidia bacterium]